MHRAALCLCDRLCIPRSNHSFHFYSFNALEQLQRYYPENALHSIWLCQRCASSVSKTSICSFLFGDFIADWNRLHSYFGSRISYMLFGYMAKVSITTAFRENWIHIYAPVQFHENSKYFTLEVFHTHWNNPWHWFLLLWIHPEQKYYLLDIDKKSCQIQTQAMVSLNHGFLRRKDALKIHSRLVKTIKIYLPTQIKMYFQSISRCRIYFKFNG